MIDSGQKVNINDRPINTYGGLTDAAGVGGATVYDIYEHQVYLRIEDLLDVPGIGEATYEKLKDRVYVGECPHREDELDDIYVTHEKHAESVRTLDLIHQARYDQWEVHLHDDEHERYPFDTEEEARSVFSRIKNALQKGEPIGDPFAQWKEPVTPDAFINDVISECKKAGSWDRSAIMSRGHEIARSLSGDLDYNDRLSEGMTQAWAEAKDEASETVGADASDWKTGDEDTEDETTEIQYHAAQLDDGTGQLQATAIMTEEAKERIEMMPSVEAEFNEDGWIISVEWRGNSLLDRRVETYEDALQLCYEVAAPTGARLRLLDKAARQIGIDRTMYRFRGVNPERDSTDNSDIEDYVFVDADSKEILHIDAYETDGLPGAIRSLHQDGVTRDNIEVWVAEKGYWLETNEPDLPQVGDYLHSYDTRTLQRCDGQSSQEGESRTDRRTRRRRSRSGDGRSRESSSNRRERTRSGDRRRSRV